MSDVKALIFFSLVCTCCCLEVTVREALSRVNLIDAYLEFPRGGNLTVWASVSSAKLRPKDALHQVTKEYHIAGHYRGLAILHVDTKQLTIEGSIALRDIKMQQFDTFSGLWLPMDNTNYSSVGIISTQVQLRNHETVVVGFVDPVEIQPVYVIFIVGLSLAIILCCYLCTPWRGAFRRPLEGSV
jgi:hypothetical protein